MMKRKSAFTLLEIVLVLAILGFIFALAMPFLINEFNKAQWTVNYKKTFSETYSALYKIAVSEECGLNLTCSGIFDGGQIDSTKRFGDSLTKNMVVAQNCGVENNGCFSHKISIGLSGINSQTLKETMANKVSFLTDFYTFRTTRGVSYALLSFGMSCLNNETNDEMNKKYIDAYVTDPQNENNPMLSLCGFIVVDVNGDNAPNTWGRDVFGIWITDRGVPGVYPFGAKFDKAFGGKCVTTSSTDTRGCASQLIEDGWRMTY